MLVNLTVPVMQHLVVILATLVLQVVQHLADATLAILAITVAVKNAVGGNSGKTKIAATNVMTAAIAVINS